MQRTLTALLVLCLNHLDLLGQAPVTNGQTVRITSSRYELRAEIGRVLTATADTLVVQVQGLRTVNYRQEYRTDTLALSFAGIDRLEVRGIGGGERQTKRGARIGLGIGAAVGLVVGLTTYQECHSQHWLDMHCLYQPTSAGQSAVLGAAAVGVVGAAVGGLVGAMSRNDKWVTVAPRGLGLAIWF